MPLKRERLIASYTYPSQLIIDCGMSGMINPTPPTPTDKRKQSLRIEKEAAVIIVDLKNWSHVVKRRSSTMLTLPLISLTLIVKDKCRRLDKAYLKLTELHPGGCCFL